MAKSSKQEQNTGIALSSVGMTLYIGSRTFSFRLLVYCLLLFPDLLQLLLASFIEKFASSSTSSIKTTDISFGTNDPFFKLLVRISFRGHLSISERVCTFV